MTTATEPVRLERAIPGVGVLEFVESESAGTIGFGRKATRAARAYRP
jgi:hypothetical protein